MRWLNKMPFILSLILLGSSQSFGFGDSLGIDPGLKWKTRISEHFRLSYPERLEPFSEQVIKYFEQAHEVLSPLLLWKPKSKTEVRLIDSTDQANGLATALGRFGIVIILTPPEVWYSTNRYDDWLKLLIVHEYTHFLNMDPTTDWTEVLRWVFGDVIKPNVLWPSWMLEGLAVYFETKFTRLGRGRDTYFDMVLRTAVDAGVLGSPKWVSFDKVNGPLPHPPFGEAPYLFGYHLWQELFNQTGEDFTAGRVSERSSRALPFFLNNNLEATTKKTWTGLWDDWVKKQTKKHQDQITQIRSQGESSIEWLTQDGARVLAPAMSADGKWIAFLNENAHSLSGLYLWNRNDGSKPKRVANANLGSQISFHPDGSWLFFSASRIQNAFENFQEIGAYDVEKKKIFWITDGKHSRDPDISSDGKRVVFCRPEMGRINLWLGNLNWSEKGKPEIVEEKRILEVQELDRISNPRFLADGKSVIAALKKNEVLGESIVQLNLETLQLREIVGGASSNRYPSLYSDDEIVFVSDRSGVDNVYKTRMSSADAPQALTNVVSGVAFPIRDRDYPERIVVSAYANSGWNLASIKAQPVNAPKVQLAHDLKPSQSTEAAKEHTSEQKDYSIWSSLTPRQWSPLFSWESRRVFIGAHILGFDTLDFQRYIFGLGYETGTNRPGWLLGLNNRSLGPTLSLSAEERTNGSRVVNDELVSFSREFSGGFSISQPIRRTHHSFLPSFSFGADRESSYSKTSNTTTLIERTSFIPRFTTALSFSSADRSRLAVSEEKGVKATIAERLYLLPGTSSFKTFGKVETYFKVDDHFVFAPHLAFAHTSKLTGVLTEANAKVVSPMPGDVLGDLGESTISRIVLRGYPFNAYLSNRAVLTSLEMRYPLFRIYRGWNTRPIFFKEIRGMTFVEAVHFPATTLPSVGTGIYLDTVLFHYAPVSFAFEYHQGLNRGLGGNGDFYFRLDIASLGF